MGTDYAKLKKFTKSQINGLTKKLSSFRWKDYSSQLAHREDFKTYIESVGLFYEDNLQLDLDHGRNCSFELHIFRDQKTLRDVSRTITKEQTTLGRDFLKNMFFMKDGKTVRNSKAIEKFDAVAVEVSKSISRFEFVGVILVYNAYSPLTPQQAMPVYRTYNKSGQWFDYCPIHWGPTLFLGSSETATGSYNEREISEARGVQFKAPRASKKEAPVIQLFKAN